MEPQTRQDEISIELAKVTELSRPDLIKRWEQHYKTPPPKGISRRLLEYSAAYQVLATVYGGLSSSATRKLMRLATSPKSARQRQDTARKSRLSPGARLVREWHGVTHTVEVLKEGFAYDGELYGSLSEVARKITGARWSGPRFFGL